MPWPVPGAAANAPERASGYVPVARPRRQPGRWMLQDCPRPPGRLPPGDLDSVSGWARAVLPARGRAVRDSDPGNARRLTEQLGAGIGDAFVRLRAYAYARDLRLTDVARDIVARRLRLRPDPSRDGEA